VGKTQTVFTRLSPENTRDDENIVNNTTDHAKTLRTRIATGLFIAAALSILLSGMARGQSFNPVPWPSASVWTEYKVKGNPIYDPKTQDPSNGGTSPQNYVNISSGDDGLRPSTYFASNGTHLFVCFRLESDPNS